MDRRELFGMVGMGGAALVLGTGGARAQEPKPGDTREANMGPLGHAHAHFCGIHVAKSDPRIQLIVQHYCAAHTGQDDEDAMFQCILFDGAVPNAKLLGVEYIVTDKVYRALPEAEKMYWHPHTYEVLAGGLIAPGMEPEKEREFMKDILTTWGKTWHTWPDPKTHVPLGEPMLIWSLMGDGQADETVIAARDREFGVSTAKVRARRLEEFGLEVPRVSPPESMQSVGRQWTNSGEDRPTPRKG